MSASALANPLLAPTDAQDCLDHFYCCDEDVALCGADLSGPDVESGGEDIDVNCVVCLDLEECGAPCREPDCPKRGENA